MRSLPCIALVTSMLVGCGAPAARPASVSPGASSGTPTADAASGAFAEDDVTSPVTPTSSAC